VKQNCFNLRPSKESCDCSEVSSSGILFHRLALATGNARSPTVTSRDAQTMRPLDEDDRRRRRDCASATRVKSAGSEEQSHEDSGKSDSLV